MKLADVQEEYKKNEDLRAEDINALQEWAAKQPHLPPLVTELQLIVFLHSCHWSLELTKATIEKYLTYRGAWTDFFANRNPLEPKLKAALDLQVFAFLKSKTEDNSKIFYFKLMNYESDRYVLKDVLKILDMVLMMEIMMKGTFDGVVMVLDCSDFTTGHILRTHITETKRILLYVQNALPVRLKALHYIIPGRICELLVPMIKPFVNKELLQHLHFHDSYGSLFKNIPKQLFPKDIGGNEASLKELHETMKKTVIENADFFVNEEEFVSNEKLRDRRPSYMDQDLNIGIDGSFKKLNLD